MLFFLYFSYLIAIYHWKTLFLNYGKSLATVDERMDQIIHNILIFGFLPLLH